MEFEELKLCIDLLFLEIVWVWRFDKWEYFVEKIVGRWKKKIEEIVEWERGI